MAKKANETVVPIVLKGWEMSKQYSSLIWVRSEPYRAQAVVYTNQAIEFVNANFPILVKNLVSVFQLTINYVSTVSNFVILYCSQAVDFVGVKLIGWQKGDLEKIFLDSFKVVLEFLTQSLQKINNCKWFNKVNEILLIY